MRDIIAVVPEYHSGPGRLNYTIMIIRYENGELTREYLQPEEMGRDVRGLFKVCATAHDELKKAVIQHLALKEEENGVD
jgi:hypothetical protein